MDPIISKYEYQEFEELNWCKKEGIMYQRDMSKSVKYDNNYYQKYVNYENTDISKKINQGRKNITEKYCLSVLDIGIGSGEFIKNSGIKVYGFDINEKAIEWLNNLGLFLDPYKEMPKVDGLSFWDSLEHIPNPNDLLSLFKPDQYAFVSVPTFTDLSKVKNNKHYRPDEHYYYFTIDGMIRSMKDSNFELIEVDDFETQAGREDITTFVFRKLI